MGGMPGSLLFVYLLAFARVVLLVVSDTIFDGPRERFANALKARNHDTLAYLFLCPWCVSIWLAIPAAPIIYAYGQHWWLYVPALGLALSAAAGVLARVKG